MTSDSPPFLMQTRPSFASRLPNFSPGGSKIPTPTGNTPTNSRPQTPLQTAPSYNSPLSTGAPTPPSPTAPQVYSLLQSNYAAGSFDRRGSTSSLHSDDGRGVKPAYDVKSQEAIVVAVRMRPLSEKEWARGDREAWVVEDDNSVVQANASIRTGSSKFNYDVVFRPESTNSQVYDVVGRGIVRTALTGINGTIFAYGVTSSGKTHTIMGFPQDPGIVPRAVRDLFGAVETNPGKVFRIKFSMMEIYNEVVNDLLDPRNSNLRIREDQQRRATVEGLSEVLVECADHALELIASGDTNRKTGATAYNDDSSRSHTICRFNIESSDRTMDGRAMRRSLSSLCIIDLAGSEGARAAVNKDQRMEGSFINRSLLTLGTVICKLSDGNAPHIPFRDSKLTRLLQGSLSGLGAKVAVVANITPASSQAEETANTLKFASRAKMVRITASRNETVDEKVLIRQMQRQIRDLTAQLEEAVASRGALGCSGMPMPDLYSTRLVAELDTLRTQLAEQEAKHEANRAVMEQRLDRLTTLVLHASRSPSMVGGSMTMKRSRSEQHSAIVSREMDGPVSPRPYGRESRLRASDNSDVTAVASHLELRNPAWSNWGECGRVGSLGGTPRDYSMSVSNSIAERLGGIVSSVSGVDLHITLRSQQYSTLEVPDADDEEKAQLREHVEVLANELGERTREIEAMRAHRRSSLINTNDSSEASDRDVELQVLLADREILQDQLAVTEVDNERLLREMAMMQEKLLEAEEARAQMAAENQMLKEQVPMLHREVQELRVQLEYHKSVMGGSEVGSPTMDGPQLCDEEPTQRRSSMTRSWSANSTRPSRPPRPSMQAETYAAAAAGSLGGVEKEMRRSNTITATNRLQQMEEAVMSALGAVSAEVTSREAAEARAKAAEEQLATCQEQLAAAQEVLGRHSAEAGGLGQQVSQMQQRISRLQGHLLDGLSAMELSELIGSLTQAVQRVKTAVEQRRAAPQPHRAPPQPQQPPAAAAAAAVAAAASTAAAAAAAPPPGQLGSPRQQPGVVC